MRKTSKVLFVFGTRPEAIKLMPLINKFKENNFFDVKVCVTAQHRDMLDQVLQFFSIIPDYDLNVMRENQSLFYITAAVLKKIERVLDDSKPDVVVVQGDTTTTFIASLASYYKKIKVAHIEAGLRSFNKFAPYPEEANRVLTSRLADYHFAPTKRAMQNLLNEGISNNVWVTGNTAIDALFLTLRMLESNEDGFYPRELVGKVEPIDRIILVTTHRRENFGTPLENICKALLEIADTFKDVKILFPVHPNPNVKGAVYRLLHGRENIILLKPLEYPKFVWLMSRASIILTDSGGLQEEAPSLGKPVLVLRKITERLEGVEAGTAILVGSNTKRIVDAVSDLLTNKYKYERMSKAVNPYGDGKSSGRRMQILEDELIKCSE